MAQMMSNGSGGHEEPFDTFLTSVFTLRIALALRLLRMWRLIFSLSSRRRRSAANLLRSSFNAGSLACSLSHTVFAQLGIALFGGRVKICTEGMKTCTVPGEAGCCVFPPAASLYVYCNFNDLAMSFVTLFELWLVNNWFVIMDGLWLASDWYAKPFCFLWWLISAVMMMNLIVAHILKRSTRPALLGNNGGSGGGGEGDDGSVPRQPRSPTGLRDPTPVSRRHSLAMTSGDGRTVQRGPAASAARRRRGSASINGSLCARTRERRPHPAR